MARLVTALAVFAGFLVVADVGADRLVRMDTADTRADMDRTRAFQDFFFARMRDLQSDIGLATMRADARWSEVSPQRTSGEFRIVLVGNSAGLFAVSPAEVARRVQAILPERIVTVIPLMVPSATIEDQVVLAQAAIDRAANAVVSFVDMDGFRATPGVASRRIADLFGRSEPSGFVAQVDRWLERRWALYRAHVILRAMAMAVASRLWPALAYDRAPVEAGLAQIEDASRHGDIYRLFAAYGRIGYRPLLRSHYRKDDALEPATAAAADELATTLARAPHLGLGIVMPFNPLLRGDYVGDPIVDPRATNRSVRLRADEVMRRLRARGAEAVNGLDALAATDFIDYVHVNERGARRFSADVAKAIRNELRKTLARRSKIGEPTASGVPHRMRHVPVLG